MTHLTAVLCWKKFLRDHDNFGEIVEIKKDLGETKSNAKNILKISKKNILTKKEKFIITNSTAFSWSKSKISKFNQI